jgi:glycosyltransferase involved in cell wall biosynthesis
MALINSRLASDDPHVLTLNGAAREAGPRRLSIVIPTRNEELNVGPLLEQLASAFDPADTELLVVDDSDDETPDALVESAADSTLAVRLIHRPDGVRKGGLSGAVIVGAQRARGAWVLVMDADLQHPPETAAALANVAMGHDVDIVIGTRYAGNASSNGLAGAGRGLVSAWSTRLAKFLFPRRLATVSDPMSGLFAFRRDSVSLNQLKPVGFKILLEILVRTPRARVAEVAYCFAPRYAGRSKASFRQGLTYLRHLGRLRRARLASQLRQSPPTRAERVRQAIRFFAFGIVGLTGVVVNTAALWFFYKKLGWNHLVGASLATQVSTTWNFLLVDSLIYRKRAHGTRGGRAIRFFLMNNLLLLARLPVLQLLIVAGMGVLAANAVTLVLLFLVRFVVSDRAIFGSAAADKARDPVRILVDLTSTGSSDDPAGQATPSRKRSRYLTYRYDIAGVVTIGSQIRLPELEFFRAQWVADDEVDIAVRVGDVGRRTPHRRASMTQYVDPTVIRYEEHFGRIGANFRIHLGQPILVEVGPLLARSCHVVYTNIIEPLLRFVMVTRDRMLLHSACVEVNGVGVMLSALTDTGKTGTVLRLLREHGGRFLSDDMTVIDAHGNAWCFPKPLTISAHTLRAVSADDLTRSEWRKLQFQSRLHSKGGRSIALTLAKFNVPIMALNATTQILVPPPKYTVDRLVPCRMASAAQVRELFIIERGEPRLADLDHASALQQLITNTDDAYGFPPFRYLAPAITLDGRDYHQLREAEKDILASFLGQVRLRVLSSNTFGWADEIPGLVARNGKPEFDVWANPARDKAAMSDAWPQWQSGGTRQQRPLPAHTSARAAHSGNGHEPRGEGHIPNFGNGHSPVLDGPPALAPAPGGAVALADGHAVALADGHAVAPADGHAVASAGTGVLDDGIRPADLAAALAPAPSRPRYGPGAGAPGDSADVLPPRDTTPPPRQHRTLRFWILAGLAVAMVAAPAIALRAWHINALGFNSDEAVYSGQAAAIAGDPALRGLFPVFRAHPLLFQMAVSLFYRIHVSDMAPRVLAAVFGLATVAVGYAAGARTYGRRAGIATALLLATMPYLVVVNRQGLLDGPMAFFSVVALWLMAKFSATGQRKALYAAGAALGLAFISKETSIVLLPAAYAYLALTPSVRAQFRDIAAFFGCFAAVAIPYPVALMVAGGSSSGQHFLTWQLFRPPNHVWSFYFSVVPPAIGLPVVVLAAGTLVAKGLGHRWSWRESLMVCWIIVPLVFFQLWPVKGYQYLLPMAAPVAVLAAGLLSEVDLVTRLARGSARYGRALLTAATVAVAVWLAMASWTSINTANATSFLAGTGGVPGGRETGRWIAAHTPQGSQMLAIGPSMANILQFYGHREVLGLSVSPNPLHRNPVYTPVSNPDLLLRTGQVQYLVWDAYSAARTHYFSQRLMSYVRRYRGSVAHVQTVTVDTSSGQVRRPVIVIYEVRP